MSRLSELATVIEDLRKAAESILSAADTLTEMFGGSDTPSPSPSSESAVPAKPTITLEQVRAVLAEKSHDGFTAEIRSLLQKHGADKLSLIDPSKYESLMKDAEALGNG